ncbi:MAG TPA: ATP-binding protein [Pyrinomonadaceae bacterium]|nr:ATP-binding protein [Pyrinomonadaceae bacterium]
MSSPSENFRRILGRVVQQDFVGRAAELDLIMVQADPTNAGRGLLLLMEPSAGVSELLRQAYDQLFNQHTDVIPIYFAITPNETTAVSAAIEFLNTFVQQYIAFRRNEPVVSNAPLTLQELLELALPADLEWIEQLIESYKRLRFGNDDKALVRFCLGAPQRIPPGRGRPFVMLDGSQLAEYLNGAVVLGTEILRVFGRGSFSFVLAGLRRQILEAAHDAKCDFELLDTLRLEQLETSEAAKLVEHVARRQQVTTSEIARDLLVQQFAGSPFFINIFLQAAREKHTSLISYLDCQRLYVDELFGGHIHRHFADLLEEISPRLDTRHLLIRLLWEAAAGEEQVSSFEVWRKRLHMTASELEDVLHRLHVQEFINWDGATVEAGVGPQAWKDYLKIRYRLDVLNETRALVVADMLADSLKRAPHTMARHYKQVADAGLRDLISRFNCQRVPAVLFDYQNFSNKYKGAETEAVASGLAAETEFFKLPQTVHLASCASFFSDMRQICEEDQCLIAHTFEEGSYSDAQQVIWLAADIESKLEVDVEVARAWCDRLEHMAERLSFSRFQIWLISNEGFSDSAFRLLERRKAFGSSRQQMGLLAARVGETVASEVVQTSERDEFLMVVPMGEDNELIAANTAEQIAKRLTFRPEAINQIKTAIVEACINASEHSFSPDRKIYQRFRVESDRLVITISSRGIVPANLNGAKSGLEAKEAAEERRGWGLKLIRTLMDEVEFERVDDGTSLRMTKYLRPQKSTKSANES